jgi:hypothetical protein
VLFFLSQDFIRQDFHWDITLVYTRFGKEIQWRRTISRHEMYWNFLWEKLRASQMEEFIYLDFSCSDQHLEVLEEWKSRGQSFGCYKLPVGECVASCDWIKSFVPCKLKQSDSPETDLTHGKEWAYWFG